MPRPLVTTTRGDLNELRFLLRGLKGNARVLQSRRADGSAWLAIVLAPFPGEEKESIAFVVERDETGLVLRDWRISLGRVAARGSGMVNIRRALVRLLGVRVGIAASRRLQAAQRAPVQADGPHLRMLPGPDPDARSGVHATPARPGSGGRIATAKRDRGAARPI